MAAISVQEDGGGDYTTLEAAVENASTGDGDVITITETWTSSENTQIAVTDALTIQATGASKHIGRPHNGSETTFRHRNSSSGHSFTITDTGSVTFIGLDIQNTSTGTSDEVFRNNVANTFLAQNCVLGFASRTSEQDVFYTETTTNATFEQCHFYNVFRGCLDLTGSASGTVNINSCTAYDIGFSDSPTSRSGLVGKNTSGTMTINIYNTIVHMNNFNHPVCTNSTTANTTANIERLITNSTVVPMQSAPATANYANNVEDAVINDTDASGNYILLDTTTSPYDLRLFDNDTNNAAQDNHSTATGANLTIPSTDIVGTSRPQNTDFDIGAFEVEVAGGGVTVSVPVGAIALTGQAPTIAATANITISIPAGSISLTGQTPVVIEGANVDITVPVGAISLTGLAPTVLTGADVDITVPVGSISLTGLAPAIQATNNISVDVPVGSISLSGFAPTIQTGDFVTVEVPTGSISLSGLVPTIDLTNNISVSIPTGSISLAGFAPVVDLGDLTVIVNSGTITLSGFAPIVIIGGAVWTVQPDSVTNWSDQADSVTTWTIQ